MSLFWRHFIADGTPPRHKNALQRELWQVCETFLTVDKHTPEMRRQILRRELSDLLDKYSDPH